ncbi:MAG TPA: ammonium transporter, partial [Oceanospirillales bacterium]|nr:ammonium transporter [Oceanospirillales bacterium]
MHDPGFNTTMRGITVDITGINSAVETLMYSANTMFILLGAIMVLAMHAG